jgi:hypothetical protein
MKEWLEDQKGIEKETLDIVCQQAVEVVDQLIPQIRLCAIESGEVVKVNLEIQFDFGKETTLSTIGAVAWPPRIVEATSVTI